MGNEVVMGEASSVTFAFAHQTSDPTFNTPIIHHYQTLECYIRRHHDEFPYQLMFSHLDGDTQHYYFFSDLDSMLDWIAENIPDDLPELIDVQE